ncbi:MAG TPA: hypothetical protein VN428_20005 [Bryobacteraceae bacterium]|nr:hypothetical protein [Bryobacteraceae bacterium]
MNLNRITTWVCWGLFGLAAVPIAQSVESKDKDDPRLARLTYFLQANKSPVSHLAVDFLAAADRHGLDWRLLPAIAMVESGAGIAHARNNIFGWNSAKTGFASIKQGIYEVARKLSQSRLYREKDLEGVLETYNRNSGYSGRVKRFMLKVSATEPLRARWTNPSVAD